MLRQTGSFPLWNPYLFGGMPFVAAMHGDIFYPTFLLRMLMPTDVAMTWGFIIHTFLAGLFTYAFLRRIGLSFFAALIGGLAYMLGGNVAGLVSPGHDGKLFVAALLPLVLLFTYRAIRDGRWWAFGALAIAVTLAVLTPHPQLLQYLLLVCGAWALFLAFSADAGGQALARRRAFGRLGAALAAVAVGLLGGAIQFLPVVEYTPWSPRTGGKGWEHAISYSMPLEELINTYLPQFSGILERYSGRNGIHFHSEYIGAAVLVLAVLAFGVASRRKLMYFWFGTFIVASLWALGGYTPFYRLVYALVPGTTYFRAPSTMLYVVQFSAAVLAAMGVERLLLGQARRRYAIGWLAAAGLVGVLAASGALTNLAASVTPQAAAIADANRADLVVGAWRSFVAVAAVCGVILLLDRRRLGPRAAGWILAGVVVLDLWSIERLYWRFSPPASTIYAGDPIVSFLKTQTDSGRVYAIPFQQPEAPHDPFLQGDALMGHGIRQIGGYHGNELGRYQRVYGISPDEMIQRIGNPSFWRLANMRFLLTNAPELPLDGFRRVLGPVRNAAGSTEYLFQLPGDNPPAWVAPIAVKAPDENTLATVIDPRFDASRVALFDTAAAVPTQPVPQQLPEPLDLKPRITRRTPGSIVLELDRPAPNGATLVVSENYYPGWHASVDGRATPIGRVDYSLIGVPLTAGARRIELQFSSAPYETGKAITLTALLVSALAVAGGLFFDRRARG